MFIKPDKFYHITRKCSLPSIMQSGLLPAIGTLSKKVNEEESRVYLFDSIMSAEDAMMGWLGDELDDEIAILLEINSNGIIEPTPTYDDIWVGKVQESYEWTSTSKIEANNIQVLYEI